MTWVICTSYAPYANLSDTSPSYHLLLTRLSSWAVSEDIPLPQTAATIYIHSIYRWCIPTGSSRTDACMLFGLQGEVGQHKGISHHPRSLNRMQSWHMMLWYCGSPKELYPADGCLATFSNIEPFYTFREQLDAVCWLRILTHHEWFIPEYKTDNSHTVLCCLCPGSSSLLLTSALAFSNNSNSSRAPTMDRLAKLCKFFFVFLKGELTL